MRSKPMAQCLAHRRYTNNAKSFPLKVTLLKVKQPVSGKAGTSSQDTDFRFSALAVTTYSLFVVVFFAKIASNSVE